MNQSWFSRLLGYLREFVQGYWRQVATLTILAGVVFALIPKSIFHPFKCEVTNAPTSFESSDGFTIDGQVILRGTRTAITQALNELAKAEISLTLIEGCDLSYLNTRDNPNPNLTAEQRKEAVLQLYQMPKGLTVDNVITQINRVKEVQPNLYLDADPNYLVSRSDTEDDPCGRPESSGGTGGGKDFGDPGVLDPTFYDARKAADAFNTQWAFGSQGINLPTSPASTGDGVHVAVIDSSSFRANISFFRRVGIALPSPVWFKIRDTPASRNILSSHGLFVAELIHYVAPESKIDLIHVLDDQGCTRLMPLIEALHAYTSRRSAWTGNLNKTVINMSLGIRKPDPSLGLDDELETLEELIANDHRMGAIFVAAAGNDSNRKDELGNVVPGPMPMQIPAAYNDVLGVAATNQSGELSCYSNTGDVAAPGGDGGVNPQDRTEPCVPRTDSENVVATPDPCDAHDLENCNYGVISLALTDTGPQYVFWSGTSFSTPLVSGLAALAYQKWDQETVECLIQHGTKPVTSTATPKPVEWGMMDINKALTDTAVLTTCGVTP